MTTSWHKLIDQFLHDRPLDQEGVDQMQSDLHRLARLLITGLLFKRDLTDLITQKIEPILSSQRTQLQHIYGDDHPGLRALDRDTLIHDFEAIQPLLHTDIEAALKNDPATDDPLEVVFCYPGFKAVAYHRIAHVLNRHRIPLLPRMLAELAHNDTGIDIHPGARIGAHFFIDHGTGVVIGETTVIGQQVTLYQGVTLGAKKFPRDKNGSIIKDASRHPSIGDGVTIYSGATILGGIHIGDGSIIGGNVWLTESVPAGSRITQQRYRSQTFIDGDGI